jgi:hypothetical protein
MLLPHWAQPVGEGFSLMCRQRPNPLSKTYTLAQRTQKSPLFQPDKKCVRVEEQEKELLKKQERSGNVYEDKGPLWKKWERNGNVIDNKGD